MRQPEQLGNRNRPISKGPPNAVVLATRRGIAVRPAKLRQGHPLMQGQRGTPDVAGLQAAHYPGDIDPRGTGGHAPGHLAALALRSAQPGRLGRQGSTSLKRRSPVRSGHHLHVLAGVIPSLVLTQVQVPQHHVGGAHA